MATTNYAYHDYESLGDIANKFNTSVLNLVKLNKWLQDPNDNHTYMFPKDSPMYIEPEYDGSGNIISYKFHDAQDEHHSYISYRLLDIVVPLIGNGNASIEDYWDNVNKITGISYNILLDNVMSNGLFSNESNQLDDNKITLIGNLPNMSSAGQLSPTTNAYISDYINNYIKEGSTGFGDTIDDKYVGVDYFSGSWGNFLQSQINAGVKTLDLYRGSAIYRESNIGHTNTIKDVKYSTAVRTQTYNVLGKLGNANNDPINGQCVVIIGNTILYMPCYPEEVSDTTTVNYNNQNVLGRSEPYQAYNNSGPRAISFTFKMHREMTGNVGEIERIVRYVESSVYPNYDSSGVAAIKTSVKIGNSISITGIVTSETTNWSGPIGPDKKYNMVTITFTVTEVTGDPKTAQKIAIIGGYRASDEFKNV